MKLFKNYKKLYKDELKNREMLINQNSKLSQERIEAKEEVARLKIELEDTKGFLAQETEAKEVLKNSKIVESFLDFAKFCNPYLTFCTLVDMRVYNSRKLKVEV